MEYKIGDKIKFDSDCPVYRIIKIDTQTYSLTRYYIVNEDGNGMWDFCLGWKRIIESDDALRYGEVLTNDEFECDILDYTGFQIAKTNYYRIRTIRYEYRIFYHKMVNGEVVEFKELTV